MNQPPLSSLRSDRSDESFLSPNPAFVEFWIGAEPKEHVANNSQPVKCILAVCRKIERNNCSWFARG